jgi:hypothetical protein
MLLQLSFVLVPLNEIYSFAGDEWTDCFTVRDISLPQSPYLGFSAMTGDVSDAHE